MSDGCADGDGGEENYFHFRCEEFETTVGYPSRIVMLVVTVLVLEATGAFSTTIKIPSQGAPGWLNR